MAAYKTQTAKLKAGPLTYLSRGKSTHDAEGKEHLPAVYLHGAGGLSKSRVHDMLSADRRLIMPVIPGHNGTDFVPGVDSMPRLADFIAEFVVKKLGGRCDLIGHSFGGWLAAWVAARHPDIVRPHGRTARPQELTQLVVGHVPRLGRGPGVLPGCAAPRLHTAWAAWNTLSRLGALPRDKGQSCRTRQSRW